MRMLQLASVSWVLCGGFMGVALAMAGCASSTKDSAPAVSLPAVSSTETGTDPAAQIEASGIEMADAGAGLNETTPEGTKAIALVTLVDLPLDVSLEPAWSVVDEDVFPAITRGVWMSNGLRVGLLPKDRLAAFLSALPPNWGNRRQRKYGGDEATALVRSRPLRAEFFADLTVPPFAPQRETFRGHTATLLVEMRPQRGGFTRVTLTPQHHKPRQVIRPRTPQEKLLDGRIFEELSVTVAVPEEGRAARYLVLGLSRDARTLPVDQRDLPLPGEENDEAPVPDISGQDVAATDPQRGNGLDVVLQNEQGLPNAAEPEAAEDWGGVRDDRVEPLPLNLGRALMTTGMRGSEAQVLMIMEVRGLRE